MTGNRTSHALLDLRKRIRGPAATSVALANGSEVTRPFRSPLREIAIELTSKCNLSCKMCSVWKGRRDGIPGSLVKELLAEARRLGARSFVPCGAEILMRKDALDILRTADSLGFERQTIVTNGLLLRHHVDALAELPSVHLNVSIDGPEPVHDRLRGAGTYPAAVGGARAGVAKGIAVGLSCVLMRPTLPTASHLIDLAVAIGATQVSYQPFQPEIAGLERDHSEWTFDPDQRAEVARTLDYLLARALRSGVEVVTQSLFPEMEGYLFDGRRPVPPGGCYMPTRFILIDGRGEIYPCFFMRSRSMGNVRAGVRLRDVWHGPVQSELQRQGLAGKCPGCLAACSDIASFNRATTAVPSRSLRRLRGHA